MMEKAVVIEDSEFNKIANGDLLALLNACDDNDLDPLVSYMLRATTEFLTINEKYKKHAPKHSSYTDIIATEVRAFGGNTFANMVRGEGPPYAEVVSDVCGRVGVNPTGNVVENEKQILLKIFADAWDKLSEEKRAEFWEAVRKAGYKGASFSTAAPISVILAQLGVNLSGFVAYQIALIVANAVARQILGRGLSLAANAGLVRALAFFAGPIGWVITGIWTAIDLAGPAFRVTIPCVVHLAYLRQKVLFETIAATAETGS